LSFARRGCTMLGWNPDTYPSTNSGADSTIGSWRSIFSMTRASIIRTKRSLSSAKPRRETFGGTCSSATSTIHIWCLLDSNPTALRKLFDLKLTDKALEVPDHLSQYPLAVQACIFYTRIDFGVTDMWSTTLIKYLQRSEHLQYDRYRQSVDFILRKWPRFWGEWQLYDYLMVAFVDRLTTRFGDESSHVPDLLDLSMVAQLLTLDDMANYIIMRDGDEDDDAFEMRRLHYHAQRDKLYAMFAVMVDKYLASTDETAETRREMLEADAGVMALRMDLSNNQYYGLQRLMWREMGQHQNWPSEAAHTLFVTSEQKLKDAGFAHLPVIFE
jgi:hypothetical protein